MAERKLEIAVAHASAFFGARQIIREAAGIREGRSDAIFEGFDEDYKPRDFQGMLWLNSLSQESPEYQKQVSRVLRSINYISGGIFGEATALGDIERFCNRFQITRDQTDPSLGITQTESDVLLRIMQELWINTTHGMLGKRINEVGSKDELSRALNLAFHSLEQAGHGDAMVRAGIIFNDETQRGQVFLQHPITPQSPEFDIKAMMERRAGETGKDHSYWHEGGIYQMHRGFLADALVSARLAHYPLQTADVLVDLQDPSKGSTRRVWLEFWRSPEKPGLAELPK